jgi:hypothetical protein
MGSLVYSAIGTQHIMGGQFKALNIAKLDPGILMSSSGPTPTAEQAKADASSALGQKLRASLLQTMGLTEDDLAKMRDETRADLETNMARDIHEQILSTPGASSTGVLLNVNV